MKQRVRSVVFVAAFLLLAGVIVGYGHPTLLPAARAQDAVPAPAVIRPAKAADRKAAIASIQAQLKAFQKDDFATAIRYQSRGLKAHFPSADAFRHMMQTNYPAFLNFKSASYGQAGTPDNGQHVLLTVSLLELGGVKVQALYILVREGKTYKVDGVQGGVVPGPTPDAGPSRET